MAELASVFQIVNFASEGTAGTQGTATKTFAALAATPGINVDVKTYRPTGHLNPTVSVLGKEWSETDVAVELAEVKDVVYKIGMMVMGIYQHLELPITPAMMIGQAPATSDPALAAASQDPSLAPQPGATDGAAAAAGAQGGAPDAGAPKQASYPGEVEPPSLEELEKTAEQLRFLLSGDADSGAGEDAAGDPGEWDWAAEAMKAAAERYGPAQVGMPHAAEYRDALHTMGTSPLLMARAIQRRMR
jgi:hypothetical protein